MSGLSDSSPDSPDSMEPSANVRVEFTWRQQWEFIKKELRETLRDRRTIVTLLAMPLLLYPMLGLGFRFLALRERSPEENKVQIGFENQQDAQIFDDLMMIERKSELRSEDDSQQKTDKTPTLPLPPGIDLTNTEPSGDQDEPKIVMNLPSDNPDPGDPKFDLNQVVSDGFLDLGIRVQLSKEQVAGPKWSEARIELIVNKESPRSQMAAELVERKLNSASFELIRLWATSLNPDFRLPVAQKTTRVGAEKKSNTIVGLLPLVLLLMTVTGGVYPAIDLTAGERERNTLETLMALPVPRFRLLFAKFVAVVTVTMLTGIMNLLAMSTTLYSLQLDKVMLGDNGFSLGLGLKLFAILSTFALFYSALLLVLTSSARSFKEAQAYLIPLLLLSIGPGIVILFPGWRLTELTAIVPLINILLLSRGILEGYAELLPAVVALVTTLLYAGAALSLAAQIFGADAIAVGGRNRWSDLFHRSDETQAAAGPSLVLMGLAVLFPAYFLVSGFVSRGEGIAPIQRLGLSGVMTTILFLVFPWLLLRWNRVDMRNGFAWTRPKIGFVLGAVLVGLSAWPFVFEIMILSQQWLKALGWSSIDLSKFEQVKALLDDWATVPLPAILLALAVVPGVCEECFFRGFLFGGLERVLKGWGVIVVTAIAFGFFHVVMSGGASPERILPSFLMGLLLGWVRYRSGSLIPGILLHVLHNGSLLTIAHYREELKGWGLGAVQEEHLPMSWLGVAGIGLIVGLLLIVATWRK